MLKRFFKGLSRDTYLLTLASFFSDVSTEMLYPILPIYLTQYLKASGGTVGLIEGIATATQNAIQGLSGYLSDKWQRRKPIALFGYFLSAVSKPLIGLTHRWPVVLGARFTDRLGAGSRSAPRDALVADSVAAEHRGKAFGLEGFGDNFGAFAGPLITILLFLTLSFEIHTIFYLAIIPGLLAFGMVLMVKEVKHAPDVKAKINLDAPINRFPKSYWNYLIAILIFGIGNSSNAFLILRLKEQGVSLLNTILIYAFYNLVAALISYPSGALSDKFGRKPVLISAFVIFALTYFGFAFLQNPYMIGVLFVSYGLFQGTFRSVGKAFASDFVPAHLRASGIGWFSMFVGFSALAASIIAGQLWDKVSHQSVFIFGGIMAIAGTLMLIPVRKNKAFTGLKLS